MFTSDLAFFEAMLLPDRKNGGRCTRWLDAQTGRAVPEFVVYAHVVQNGLHFRMVVDDEQPEGVPI